MHPEYKAEEPGPPEPKPELNSPKQTPGYDIPQVSPEGFGITRKQLDEILPPLNPPKPKYTN